MNTSNPALILMPRFENTPSQRVKNTWRRRNNARALGDSNEERETKLKLGRPKRENLVALYNHPRARSLRQAALLGVRSVPTNQGTLRALHFTTGLLLRVVLCKSCLPDAVVVLMRTPPSLVKCICSHSPSRGPARALITKILIHFPSVSKVFGQSEFL